MKKKSSKTKELFLKKIEITKLNELNKIIGGGDNDFFGTASAFDGCYSRACTC